MSTARLDAPRYVLAELLRAERSVTPHDEAAMRFIHTADWHLGRLFHGLHLTDDQRHVLDGFVELARDAKPDVILVAGDIYDRAVPPPEAVELLDDVLSRLVLDLEIPVILIAGNHDSPGRLNFGSRLMAARRLYVTGSLPRRPVPVVLEDGFGPVHFYPVPYAEPATVRACLSCPEVTDHNSGMRQTLRRIRAAHPAGRRSAVIAHAFVAGGSECESERPLSVGGAGTVDAACFDGFDYTALGHLHCRQTLGKSSAPGRSNPAHPVIPGAAKDHGRAAATQERSFGVLREDERERAAHPQGAFGEGDGARGVVRYSGSLLKYSFDEADHAKSVYVVEMDGQGRCTCEAVSLTPRRDVRRVQGVMEDLLRGPREGSSKDDYLEVILLDEGVVLDAIGRLREVYPNVMSIRRPDAPAFGPGRGDRPDVRKMNDAELFRAFYAHVKGADLTAGQEQAFAAVVEDMLRTEREADAVAGAGEGEGDDLSDAQVLADGARA